jgi:hypothetical protein
MAGDAFRRALELDDDNAEAHDGLGVVLRERGHLPDAIFEHMRAASLLHHRPQTHIDLGVALAHFETDRLGYTSRFRGRGTRSRRTLPSSLPRPTLPPGKAKSCEGARAHPAKWTLRSRLRGRRPALITGA